MKLIAKWLRASATAGASVALLAAPGCMSATGPPVTLFWTATVEADAGAPFWLGGTAEMVANAADSSVGIFLDADPDGEVTVFWQVRYGPCSGSGERIAPATVFPPVRLTAGSRGVGLASIRRRVPPGTYAAVVHAGPEGEGPRLACAELRERTGT